MNFFEKAKRIFFNFTYKKTKLNPPSIDEQILISNLRSRITSLAKINTSLDLEIDSCWFNNKTQIRESILNNDPRYFTDWKVIKNTMLYEPPIEVLKFMQKLPVWSRWKEAIKESPVGNPRPYWAFKESSGTLIHHAYHLSQLLLKTSCSIENMSQILEFGAGYGSMCRLIHQLGFNGRYIIFDLPEFTALQEYFISSVGIPSKITRKTTSNIEKSIVLLSDFEELAKQLSDQMDTNFFIATWSISEIPISFRKKIFDLVPNVQYYLIGYQKKFGEISNLDYFVELTRKRTDYFWWNYEIDHLKENYYLVGRKKIDPD
ncbi:MAG: hypothetical protein DYG83_06000 [Candidatus Brocadia sp. AMX2]|uniref:Sugar O-methyltransferase n=1 Tax=Candidatus Brocadia sinica JPN1 TaxID=1197129 RepID=A0ABQ0JY25_9BACT|nr:MULTISPECIES: hypothetical protein [Brocadia]MBC6932013.1 hypothetical protein [Candidatus Brocadia sp.]MBL1169466.1 hypothetical protein [Candidatus Brocadia sp. AMX1]NOG40819.1 hypothetical protein [Planctomycetota bacterium]GIK13210.1 MAG: hypothetical protein BroJett002_19170 [Candidatus Brocadia sinica]KAA0242646.1 MAG: hypothetical protein EDM70_13320 [Candidatus Brocadia sp. AMX2]